MYQNKINRIAQIRRWVIELQANLYISLRFPNKSQQKIYVIGALSSTPTKSKKLEKFA